VRPISKKMAFALQAVVDIAYNAGAAPVQSKEITRRQQIPQRYLEQVMQQLVRAGVLKGVRGPRGGYRLARERRRISLGDIARVVSEVERGEDQAEALADSELGLRVVRPLCQELEEELMRRLDDITIEDLCRRARAEGVQSALAERLDYTI
jgi:Rrf2 family protein